MLKFLPEDIEKINAELSKADVLGRMVRIETNTRLAYCNERTLGVYKNTNMKAGNNFIIQSVYAGGKGQLILVLKTADTATWRYEIELEKAYKNLSSVRSTGNTPFRECWEGAMKILGITPVNVYGTTSKKRREKIVVTPEQAQERSLVWGSW